MVELRRSGNGFRFMLPAIFWLHAQAGLAEDVVVNVDISYKSGSGLSEYERERCALDLYVPEGAADFPVIVWFHGGGLTAGDKAEATQAGIARSLAARGIGVASVNYRLSPRAGYPAYVEDAAASVAWVLDHIADFGGDPANVFVSGHSAGAHLVAACLATDWTARRLPADLIKGALMISGIYDPAPAMRTSVNADIRLTPEIAAR